MQLQEELKNKLGEISNKYKENELKSAYEGISERYMNAKRTGNSLLSSEKDVVAYANARMPATYPAVYTAFSKGLDYINVEEIKTLIDIGAGTGAATWAINESIRLEKITCVEKEKNMLEFGKNLMQGSKLEEIVSWKEQDLTNKKLEEKADLIVASYMLNEIEESKKIKILENLWNNANELLFIIEPGTPENYKNILKYRDYIIQNGGYILAPCPHQNKCELPIDDW